jgi:predicted transcriptional regulator
VETLSQQHHDLEAGVTMFLQKKGPPEEAERLRERAERHRQLLARMKSELSAAR